MYAKKKLFTDKEIGNISNNPYVKSVSAKGITSLMILKVFYSWKWEWKITMTNFWEKCFDVDIIGIVRVNRAAYKESGVLGIRVTSKDNSGRPTKRELSLEQTNAR